VKASKAAWLAPGCRLDRYDLLLQVAEGGMGSLWLARQEGKHGFERIVAIKTILPKLASDAEFRRMFLDEARVVSRIEHPNVAQVLDLGEERGVLFLVMEWIDGDSLNNIGRSAEKNDGRIPLGVLSRIMVDACAGVHAAHELTDDEGLKLGVVHRDLSPQNLLVGFGGTTKVIDFGIAKARNRATADTSVGLLKGKIAYMAPEQAMGGQVDRRTDVWSAGASMYRFLSGRTPYNAENALALLRQVSERLPPAPLPTSIPEPIRLVVEKAIERDPDHRFETALELGIHLEKAMREANVYATREEVAAFMTHLMGGARVTRTRDIENAVRESRSRVRVEVAKTQLASDAMFAPLPVALEEERLVLVNNSAGMSRPSRQPTAIVSSQPEERRVLESHSAGMSRPSRQPTAIVSAQPSVDRAEIAPPVARPSRFRLGMSRRAIGWIAAACSFGVLLVCAVTWRAARHSRPIGAGAAMAVPPAGAHGPLGALGLPPGSTPVLSETIAPPTPPLPVAAPAIAHARDHRAAATLLIEPTVADQGSADDLLARARGARRAGRLADAAVLFGAAIEKTPSDSEALEGLAEVDEARGESAKAIGTYRRALAVNPRYLPARLGLADALWTSGQRDEARAFYRSIVDEVPAAMCPDVARERAAGKG
jgi:hypothetical protein